jgi:hypothetical protein
MTTEPKYEDCLDCLGPNYLFELSPYCASCYFKHQAEKRVAA